MLQTNYQCKNDNFTFSAIGITIQDTESALYNIYIP